MDGRKIARILLVVFCFLLLTAVFQFKVKGEMVDFEVNYKAAKRFQMGETLYRSEDGHYQFKYSPFSAFLYLPLSLLPLAAAKAVWFGLILASSIGIFYLSLKLIKPEAGAFRACLWLPPLILAKFFFRELELGQINALLTFLLVLMVRLAWKEVDSTRRQEWTAGFTWGAAIALKPYALIFFPYFALKKKWKLWGAGLVFLAFSLLSPALFYGIKGTLTVHREWQETLSLSTPLLFTSQDNISLTGFFHKWIGNSREALPASLLAIALVALFFILLMAKGRGMRQPHLLESFLLLFLIPLISPLGWDYTLLSSAPAVMLLIRHFDKFPRGGRLFLGLNFVIIALSLYDILGKNFYAAFMGWSIPTVNFFVLAGYLGYLRLKKYA